MLSILYSFLFSYMIFFSICVAPVISNTLDKENSSKVLRKIFPRNFIFGITICFLIILASLYYDSPVSLLVALIVLLFFLINLFLLVPKINREADKTRKLKIFTKNFKKLHLISVTIYLLQILICLIFIIYDYIN